MASKKGKNKSKKKGRKVQSRPSLKQQINAWFQDRNPILKFLLGFVGCMALFYLFYNSGLYHNILEYPFLNAQVHISNALLRLLGQDTAVVGTAISSSAFSVNLKNGCDGLEPIAILVSGILIFPVPFRYKIPGLLWGILILMVLNLIRIAALYLVGRYFNQTAFDVMHIQGGFIIFTLISVLMWFIWMNWASQKMQTTVAQ